MLLCTSGFSLRAQELEISFDLSNAVSTLKLLRQKNISDQEFNNFLSLAGTKALIEKVKSSPDTMRSAIEKVIREQPLTNQEKRFQFRYIAKNLDSLQQFVTQLAQQQKMIETSIRTALLPYIPQNKKMAVTIYGTLGGFSMGYTLGGDSSFYLGIHFYKSDLVALIENCKHELFHNIQAARYPVSLTNDALEKKNKRAAFVHAFICYLFKEGTAEYVADMTKLERTPKIKELVEHAEVNNNRSADVFYLFERLMIDAYTHTREVDFNKTYSILFDWNWNNPAYYMGYQMMKSLETAKGNQILKKYLDSDPVLFFLDYIELSKSTKSLAPFAFSSEFETILLKVNHLVKSLKNN